MITLTTDFGYKDYFVGQMKGVILSINPRVTIIDITHDIQPQCIEEGAFVIGSTYSFFPSGTIHIAVVDPGVGSGQRGIVLEAAGHYFIGPDNGIFSYVISSAHHLRAVEITETRFVRSKDSPTFHGRDVFSPVAAWLSKGVVMEEYGPFIGDLKRFSLPEPVTEGRAMCGEVIYVDRFGNAYANVRNRHLSQFGNEFCLTMNEVIVTPLKHYNEAMDKELHYLINSSDYLELFVNGDSAAKLFGIKKGDRVKIQRARHEKKC